MIYIKDDFFKYSEEIVKEKFDSAGFKESIIDAPVTKKPKGYVPLNFALSVRTVDNYVVGIGVKTSVKDFEKHVRYVLLMNLEQDLNLYKDMSGHEIVMTLFARMIGNFFKTGEIGTEEHRRFLKLMRKSQFQYLGYLNRRLSLIGPVIAANIIFNSVEKDELKALLRDDCKLYSIDYAKMNARNDLSSLMKTLVKVKEDSENERQ